jgi:hypothetical protein
VSTGRSKVRREVEVEAEAEVDEAEVEVEAEADAEADRPPLLVARSEGCRLLGGISVSSAIRLEALGLLTPIKLSPSPNGKTFYNLTQLMRLAQQRGDER